MKIAASSASFTRSLAAGTLTHLEWLDLCANELELDGIAFDVAHFPRDDAEYLAQLKKTATDLGLTVAALVAGDLLGTRGRERLDAAVALGAPLVIVQPPAGDDAAAWGSFTEALGERAREAKRANVTLALRAHPASLCRDTAALRRAAKDVDSAWVRFALDPSDGDATSGDGRMLEKTAIAVHTVADPLTFATGADGGEATTLIRGLARFRGFIVLDAHVDGDVPPDAFHRAVDRFRALRATALTRS